MKMFSKKSFLAVSLLLVILFATGVGLNAVAGVPDETEASNLLNKYFAAAQAQDVDAMMSLSVDTRQSTEETKSLYNDLFKQDSEIPVLCTVDSIERDGFDFNADTTLTMKDGHIEKVAFKIKRIKGVLKVYITP